MLLMMLVHRLNQNDGGKIDNIHVAYRSVVLSAIISGIIELKVFWKEVEPFP